LPQESLWQAKVKVKLYAGKHQCAFREVSQLAPPGIEKREITETKNLINRSQQKKMERKQDEQ
jgi:hypothetical protein